MHSHQSLILFVFIVGVMGCARIPTQEMSDARQAIQAARDVEAEYYVPTIWAKAEQNLRLAEKNLETGKLNDAGLVAILAKQQAVNAHAMAIAVKRAQEIWQTIWSINHSADNGYELLKKIQFAIRQGDFHNTIAFAETAYIQGKQVLNQIYLDKTKVLLDKIHLVSLNPEEVAKIKLAQMAHYRQEGKKAYDLVTSIYQKLL